jgi:RimJ/RimL family protein N-acetyltransferase
MPPQSSPEIQLRDVTESDLPIFFANQSDREAVAMAALPARDRGAHFAQWKKAMADGTNILKSILVDGKLAGNLVSWDDSGKRQVGYWLGREFWGRGIATRALQLFLEVVKPRPLYAHAARRNRTSGRVLMKCGFRLVGADGVLPENAPEPVAEYIFQLD